MRAILQSVLHYVKSFECRLLGSTWLKVLVATDNRNRVLQAQHTKIDVEVRNLEGLLEDLSNLRANWVVILSEAKTVATVMDIDLKFVTVRPTNRKRFHDERMNEIRGTSSEQNLQQMTCLRSTFSML